MARYVYDARNRLVRTTYKSDNDGIIDSAVDYVYGMFNHRIETIADSNGMPNAYEFYIYDGDNIASGSRHLPIICSVPCRFFGIGSLHAQKDY